MIDKLKICLSLLVVHCLHYIDCSDYMISSPRRWTSDAPAQVCFQVSSETPEDDYFYISLKSDDEKEDLIEPMTVKLPAGRTELCRSLNIPHVRHLTGLFRVEGTVGGKNISHDGKVTLAKETKETYVSTDKYLYKPGQIVKFRILTLRGPFLDVSMDPYGIIWIENPQGTRIAQWRDVDNPGLIHLELQLTDEPEEGEYTIKVRSQKGVKTKKSFKIEEFVLPRYEVSIVPPPYILGNDKQFSFSVCAKYTYGQPVKGNATITLNNSGWGRNVVNKLYSKKLDNEGCGIFEAQSAELNLNGERRRYSYKSSSILATAFVIEEGTNIRLEAESSSVSITRTALQFENIGEEEYYKPNLPFTGKVKVTWPDKSNVINELMEVCSGSVCKNIKTDSQGILNFVIPPHIRSSVLIKAVNYVSIKDPFTSYSHIMYTSEYNIKIQSYYSPTGSSIIISPKNDKLSCNKYEEYIDLNLPVMFSMGNQSEVKLNIMVVSRGQVQYMKSENYNLTVSRLHIDEDNLLEPLKAPNNTTSINTTYGTIQIKLTLRNSVSPKAKVLAWIVRDDDEVVSDMRIIEVAKCLRNNVKLSWGKTSPQPGEQSSLKLTAEPGSICSVGVVDKSVELLSSPNKPLTVDTFFEIINNAEVIDNENAQFDDYTYCSKKKEKEDKLSGTQPPEPEIFEPIPLPGIARPMPNPMPLPFAPELLFEDVVNVDAEISDRDTLVRRKRSYWRPQHHYSNYVDASQMFQKSGLNIFTNLVVETRPCETRDHHLEMMSYSPGRSGINHSLRTPYRRTNHKQLVPVHNVVDYKQKQVKKTSTNKQRTYFPETWLWNLFLLDDSGDDVQPLKMPDTITEWVGRAVCVHSSKGVGLSNRASVTVFTPFFVDLTLPPTVKRGEILPVIISTFNYLDHELPVNVILYPSDEYEILEDGSEIASTNQTASGIRTICINPQDKKVLSVRIRPNAVGDVNLTIEAFVDSEMSCNNSTEPQPIVDKRDLIIKPIKVEVEGFPREDTWTKYICSEDVQQNLDILEQWQIKVPPIIVEDSARGWVNVVGDLLGPTLDNLGHLVRMPTGCGEQNMLNFAPNIYVLQYLDASNQTTEEIKEKTINFMKTGYQRELNYRHDDGSFSAFGNSDASGSTWLTAFVLKSFAQSGQYIEVDNEDLSMTKQWLQNKQLENGCFKSVGKVLHKGMKGGAADEDSPVVLSSYALISLFEAGEPNASKLTTDGLYCLEADNSTDIYTMAVKAYALSLRTKTQAIIAVSKLLSAATHTSNSISWDVGSKKGEKSPLAVEIAGYAVLAMTTLNYEKYKVETRKVVKWISAQRNGQGGFVSTQDTVVALQALASYEKNLYQGPVDLTVMVDDGGINEHRFKITDANKLLQQQVILPQLPTYVSVDIVGNGCTLVQTVLRYNIPDAEPSDAFTLTVDTSTAPDKSCKTKNIKVCASYLIKGENSNMAVIEINLQSGYIPKKQNLKQIVGYGAGLFKRYEVDGSQVNLYVDEFSENNICADFDILREVVVENAKPGTVRVYDYYKPELSVNKKYTLPPPDECNNDLSLPFEDLIIRD